MHSKHVAEGVPWGTKIECTITLFIIIPDFPFGGGGGIYAYHRLISALVTTKSSNIIFMYFKFMAAYW